MTPHIGAEVKIRPSGLVLDHERRIAHFARPAKVFERRD